MGFEHFEHFDSHEGGKELMLADPIAEGLSVVWEGFPVEAIQKLKSPFLF